MFHQEIRTETFMVLYVSRYLSRIQDVFYPRQIRYNIYKHKFFFAFRNT